MNEKTGRLRRAVITGAAALGIALGTAGIGWAASPATAPTDQPAAPVTEIDEDPAVQDPSYQASVTAPAEDASLTEAEEAALLEGLATITADEAAAAATAAVAGHVVKVELDNENGAVVYSVEITDAAGNEIDVKIDAGNGAVLDQQADNDTAEADEADDDVQHENEYEGENDADEDHED